jgi:predicted alpha/beta hydrolase family esterase
VLRVRYPAMPNEGEPSYGAWRQCLLAELAGMSGGAVLVGHSLGGSILMKLVAEGAVRGSIAGIVLIAAPFWGKDNGWRWPEVELQPDADTRLPAGVPLHLYHGSADEIVPPAHLDFYAKAFPRGVVHRLDGRNHQLNDDLSEVARAIEALG